MIRPARRLLLALAMIITSGLLMFGAAQPAAADDCKPPAIPDQAGSGMPGVIDDQTTSTEPASWYGKYGWSGLRWNTCDMTNLVGMPTAEGAMMSVQNAIGNAGMGTGTFLAAVITQLHQWSIDPGEVMQPIDDVLGKVTKAIEKATWTKYAAVVMLLAAIGIILNATRGEIRSAMRTAGAVLVACLAVAWVTTPVDQAKGDPICDPATGKCTVPTEKVPGAVAAASMFDDLTTKVNGDVADSLNQYVGNKGNSNDEVVGATMNDRLLYRLWVLGEIGPPSSDVAKKYADKLYKASTVSYADIGKANPDNKRNEYNKLAQQIKKDDPTAYDTLRGVKSGRAGYGALAAINMIMIAAVRVPAALMMIAGLLALRVLVMCVPILAMLAIVPATRPIAVSAAKLALRQLVNVIIYGVITAIHAVAVGAIATYSANLGILTGGIMLLTLVCIVIMIALVVRSVRAHKELAKETVNNVTDAPGQFAYDVRHAVTAVPHTVATNMPFQDAVQNYLQDPDDATDRREVVAGGGGTHVHVAYREEPMPPPEPIAAPPASNTGQPPEERERSVGERLSPVLDAASTVATATGHVEIAAGLQVGKQVIGGGSASTDQDDDDQPAVDTYGSDSRPSTVREWYPGEDEQPATPQNQTAPGMVTTGRSVEVDVDVDVEVPEVDVRTGEPVIIQSNDRQDVSVDVELDIPVPTNPAYDANDHDDDYFHPEDEYASDDSYVGGDQTVTIENHDHDQIHVNVQNTGGGTSRIHSEQLDADGNPAPPIWQPDEEMAGAR